MSFIRFALGGVLLSALVACDRSTSTSPSGSSSLVVDIWSVRTGRWASSGSYFYEPTYRFENQHNEPVTVTITGAALIGPNGESLGGVIAAIRMPPPVTVGPMSSTEYKTLTVDDNDASHPFADQLQLRVSYSLGASQRTAAGNGTVLHGPQTARVLDFTVSPPNPNVGDTITVRWNVQSARQVILRTPISWDPNQSATRQFNFEQEVEHVGSRDFLVRRSGLTYVDLDADGIFRSVTLVPR
jgi:hypothetical protein